MRARAGPYGVPRIIRSNHKFTTASNRTGPLTWCDYDNSTGVKFIRALHSALPVVRVLKIARGPWLDVTEAHSRLIPMYNVE